MKTEILRINNLNSNADIVHNLENISLYILEGEIVGFLGLSYSGKDFLVRILIGEALEDIYDYHIYVEGKRISSDKELKKKIYRIAVSNYKIDDWTVAEYIGLVDCRWLQEFMKKNLLEEEVRGYFSKFDIVFDVSRKMKELTEVEKRIADIVKAYRCGAKIVIIEDEFEGMHLDAIKEFASILKRLIAGRMSVIVNSYSDTVASILCEKYIIFKEGCIVKKCKKEYIENGRHLELFILGNKMKYRKKSLDSYTLAQSDAKDIVYSVKGMKLNGVRKGDFDFRRGEVVTFLILEKKERERIFLELSGRKTMYGTHFIAEECEYDYLDFQEFVRKKIVSVMHMGSKEEIFVNMSVEENMLLPSIRKISSLEYMLSSGSIFKMLRQNMSGNITSEADEAAGDLEINDIISITLERWYIYNPKVLVLFEPFVQCDVYGVSLVKSYIKKFANKGTAVIIIKSREEYVEDISDQIISIE